MGYTKQSEHTLEYPDFPSSVQQNKEKIAKLTAMVILAKEEITSFEQGRHPNEQLIKDWLTDQR